MCVPYGYEQKRAKRRGERAKQGLAVYGIAVTLLKLTGRVMNGDMILDDTERDRCRVAQRSWLNGRGG